MSRKYPLKINIIQISKGINFCPCSLLLIIYPAGVLQLNSDILDLSVLYIIIGGEVKRSFLERDNLATGSSGLFAFNPNCCGIISMFYTFLHNGKVVCVTSKPFNISSTARYQDSLNCLPACFAKFAFGIIIFVFVQDL
jgi:hypothetical protein